MGVKLFLFSIKNNQIMGELRPVMRPHYHEKLAKNYLDRSQCSIYHEIDTIEREIEGAIRRMLLDPKIDK
jgi:hypothetical protein